MLIFLFDLFKSTEYFLKALQFVLMKLVHYLPKYLLDYILHYHVAMLVNLFYNILVVLE
jgi:hypothetical protein